MSTQELMKLMNRPDVLLARARIRVEEAAYNEIDGHTDRRDHNLRIANELEHQAGVQPGAIMRDTL